MGVSGVGQLLPQGYFGFPGDPLAGLLSGMSPFTLGVLVPREGQEVPQFCELLPTTTSWLVGGKPCPQKQRFVPCPPCDDTTQK